MLIGEFGVEQKLYTGMNSKSTKFEDFVYFIQFSTLLFNPHVSKVFVYHDQEKSIHYTLLLISVTIDRRFRLPTAF